MFDPNQPYDLLSFPETGSLPPEPPPPPRPVPVTYYSTGAAAGGPDESQDRWTNAGYTSTGRNLTPGIAAVNESVYPLGTIFRDGDTGDVFIAADRHGNSDASIVDIYKSPDSYQPRKENRNLSVIGQLEKVPSTIDGINAALAQYRSATPASSSRPGFDPSQPFEVLSYGPVPYEDPAPPPTGSSPFHQPRRRFTPEQLRSFAALSGLGPAMAAESLPLRIAATNAAAARVETPGDRGYFITPTSTGREAREDEPSAPIEGYEPPANEPSAAITVPHQAARPSAVVTVPQPPPRPSAVVTVPRPTGRPSSVVTVPRDLMQPQSSADPTSPHDGGIIRAVGNGTNSVFRGAISEGYQQAAEGLYNMLGSMLGRNPHSNISTPDLRIHLRIAEQKLAVEEAAIKARLKRQPRGFAPPPDYGKLKDTVRSITDELNSRHGNGESFIHSLRSFAESTQQEAARQRQVTRDFFDVDDDFANSAAGNIFEGIGSLATLPLNASVAGLPVTIAQTYQGGYDDYVQSRKRQGLPVNRDEAERAAATYLATVGPAEALLDKFVVGKILSSMKGKATVGQTLTKLGFIGASGGLTNAADQAYLNALAKHLQSYDPERSLDQGVLESFAFGTALSGVGGHRQHTAAPESLRANFDPEKAEPSGKAYYVVAPGSNASSSPVADGDRPNLQSGRFNERESQPPQGFGPREKKGQGRKAFEAELERLKKLLEKYDVEFKEGPENQAEIKNDRIILNYSSDAISGREFVVTREEKGKWRENWGEASRLAIGEELIHLAHLLAIQKEWKAKGAKRETFEAYFNAENRKVFLDIKNTIMSANEGARKHLEQTLLDCFNTYYGNSRTGERRAANINEAFAFLGNEQWSIKFTVEFLRQVTQLKRQGRINEEIHATFSSKIGAWVRDAIERIKALLPCAYEGEFGPEALQALQKIEAELDLIENSP